MIRIPKSGRLAVAVSTLALVAGVGALASSPALAAPTGPAHVSKPAAPAPAIPTVTIAGTFSCGTIVKEPPLLGSITWAPYSGAGGIGVIHMNFVAKNCLITSGKFAKKFIKVVDFKAAFPINPNLCPFLPAPGTYIEDYFLTYPGINFGVHIAPSYSNGALDPGAYWKNPSALVGGSFATTGAYAQYRPVAPSGHGCAASLLHITTMTLAPTSANYLQNF
jgi:hypothetical protein